MRDGIKFKFLCPRHRPRMSIIQSRGWQNTDRTFIGSSGGAMVMRRPPILADVQNRALLESKTTSFS